MSSASPDRAQVTVLRLDPDAASRLGRWSADRRGSPYGSGYAAYADGLAAALHGIPAVLREALAAFRGRLGHAGALLVQGLPVPAELPPTPGHPFNELRTPVGTEAIVLAAASLASEVISFPDWHGGDRVQNIYPLPNQALAQNASNSVYLELHTETAFRPDTPDLVVLLCLRAGQRTATLLCDGIAAWKQLTPRERRLLAAPAFAFELPGGCRTAAKPLVTRAANGPRLNYAEAVRGVDAEHQSALANFHEALRAGAEPVVLEPGDVLLLDNAHLVHGRTALDARYDGTDRWLQRALGRAARQPASFATR